MISRAKALLRRWRQEWKYLAIARVLTGLERRSRGGSRRLFLPELATTPPPDPILVFAPHPDDETFGPGGMLAWSAAHGRRVQVVVVTDGALGADNPQFHGQDLARIRENEAALAAKALGLPPFIHLRLHDQDPNLSSRLSELLPTVVHEQSPSTILTPFPLDFHGDHLSVTRAVSTCLSQSMWPGEVWLYECAAAIYANTLVDISAYEAAKEAGIAAYSSQIAANDYARAILHGLNRYRSYGSMGGRGLAEGFFRTDARYLSTLLQEIPTDL